MLLLLLALLALFVSHRGSIPLLLIIFLSWICLHQDAGQGQDRPGSGNQQTWLLCKHQETSKLGCSANLAAVQTLAANLIACNSCWEADICPKGRNAPLPVVMLGPHPEHMTWAGRQGRSGQFLGQCWCLNRPGPTWDS